MHHSFPWWFENNPTADPVPKYMLEKKRMLFFLYISLESKDISEITIHHQLRNLGDIKSSMKNLRQMKPLEMKFVCWFLV